MRIWELDTANKVTARLIRPMPGSKRDTMLAAGMGRMDSNRSGRNASYLVGRLWADS